jgi:hypothetical protein
MIEVMQGLAKRILPIRPFFIVLASLCALSFVYIVLSGDKSLDIYLFPSVVLFGWSFCLFGIAGIFRSVPDAIVDGDGFFLRWKKRIRRAIAWLWSLGFMTCTILLVYLSYKSIKMSLSGF